MNVSHVGKFQMRTIVDAIDASLINRFGVNMLDARISRQEALEAYNRFNCSQQAAEYLGEQRKLTRLAST